MSELDDFLKTINGDSPEDPFTQNEDPFAQTIEESVTTEEPRESKEEDKLPFHKDPKVQKYIQKEIEKATKSIAPIQSNPSPAKEEDSLGEVLERIIGNDTPEKVSAIKDFKKELVGLRENAKREALEEVNRKAQVEKEEEDKARQELENAFESIEDKYNVDLSSNSPQAKKTRNDFIEFIHKIAPKDSNGEIVDYPDFDSAYEIFSERTKVNTNSRAKELATRSMARSSDSSAPKQTDKSWRAVEKWFSSLTK